MKIIHSVKLMLKNYQRKKRKSSYLAKQYNSFGLSVDKVKKSNKLGFTADEYVIYDFDHNDPNDYISEYERLLFRERARDYRILMDNKIVFYNLIRNFAPVNTIYAYKIKGCYCEVVEGFSINNLILKLEETGKIVYKLEGAGGGTGFKLLAFNNGTYSINCIPCTANEIARLLRETDGYILEEYCEQSRFENELFPHSVNTLRIITAECADGTYKVLAALQRMGAEEKSCVDNACAGGLYAKIDIESGEMGVARSRSSTRMFDESNNMVDYIKHPISGAQIKGTKIPDWEIVMTRVIELHKKLSFTGIPYVAWDIALTDNGFRIIEANTSSGLIFLQTFCGERNGEIGVWMKERGYIE